MEIDHTKLFNYLQEHLDKFECNGTLRYTELFCKLNKINFKELEKTFLYDTSAFCDCEVLMNSFDDEEYALRVTMEDKK